MIDETGAWHGEGTDEGRTLTPEQNKLVTDSWHRAQQGRAELDRKLVGIEESHATRGGRLEGLEYSLKGLDSLRRKVAKSAMRGVPVEELLEQNNDLHRYTLTFPTAEYTAATEQVYGQLREQGYRPVPGSEKNTWEDPVYKGLNTTWENPDRGEKFELQFHTPDSFRAKMDNHELYELARSDQFKQRFNDPELEKSYLAATDILQNERYENVAIPPGVERLGERKIRVALDHSLDPAIVENVRRFESEVRAENEAKAAAAKPSAPAEAEVSEDLTELLQDDGPSLRDRIQPPGALPAQRTDAPAPTLGEAPLPGIDQGRPKGRRL
ncbi:hypothetical protein [Streptomyces sp. NPDC005805]|uniref:hypothetical protein n=1 Tax=Streptomyces sp. NPDC005805 TaxID=3157068 RepID=UPI0033DEA655